MAGQDGSLSSRSDLVNLVVSARDAIDGAGRIIVEMANLSVDERYHSQWPEMAGRLCHAGGQ